MSDDMLDETLDMVAADDAVEALSVDNIDDEKTGTTEQGGEDEQDYYNKERKVTRRGLGFCPAEDYLVCKSWVQAKKKFPSIKREDLMDEMLIIYDNLRTQDAGNGKPHLNLPVRTAASIFQRFRKVIAPCIAKMHSLMESSPQGGGESDQHYWDRMMKAYSTNERHQFVFRDCFEFLLPTPEFGQYNKKLTLRFSSIKRESEISEASAATITLPFKKVKADADAASSVDYTFPDVSVTTRGTTLGASSNISPARLFSSRGGKSGTFSSRGGSHAVAIRTPRVNLPTGSVFQDEMLRLLSELVDVTHTCLSSFMIERSDDDEAKKNYANAVLRNETLRIQEEALTTERRVGALSQSNNMAVAKSREDGDVESRIKSQEQFWLGDEKTGSMKDRLETLEMFINSEIGVGGFHNRLLTLEKQSGAQKF